MWFGGPASAIDGSQRDGLDRLSIYGYGVKVRENYLAQGATSPQCATLSSDPALGAAPLPAKINAVIYASMGELGSFDTRAGPDGGNLACAWSVNCILAHAGIQPIGANPNSVPSVEAALQGGRGQRVNRAEAEAGDIVIAGNQHHIGICLEDGCCRVRSNSSSRAQFA